MRIECYQVSLVSRTPASAKLDEYETVFIPKVEICCDGFLSISAQVPLESLAAETVQEW